jgi:predicted nucleotide-binding protein
MKPTILVSSSEATHYLLRFLQEELSHDANVVTWADSPFSLAQPPLAHFSRSATAADFVVIIADLADAVVQRGAVEARPRDNVIFELGFFIGRLGSDRVLIVDTASEHQRLSIPTDLAGLTVLRVSSARLGQPRVLAKTIADEVRRRTRHLEHKPQTESASYSCFISYSHEDAGLASRLYEDLSDIGARCWIDQHELRVGDSILDQVTAALLATDKFLPILSSASIRSPWFGTEIKKALELEKRRAATVLLPIRVDDAVFSASGDPWAELRDRLIADFRDWRTVSSYRTAFRRLALSLAVSASEDRSPEAP